jgi:outer membrane protein TolC
MRNNAPFNRLILAAAIALLPAGPAALGLFAETAPDTLTVDQAVGAALANNLAVKSAAVESRIKQRASEFSWNKFLPSISVSATALELNKVSQSLVAVNPGSGGSGASGIYFTPDKANLALGLTIQEVFSPVYFGLMDQAAIDYQRSLISKTQAERSMAATVRKIFYQLLVQDQAIELTRSRLETAKERLRQVEVSYKLGQGTELNYVYSKMNVENLTPDLQAMETARVVGITQFQQALGFDTRPDMKLVGSLDDQTAVIDGLTLSEYDRFDVRLAQQGEKQLESALKLESLAYMPNLIVQYKADPTLNGPGVKNSLTGKTTSIWDSNNWNQSSGALSLTLSWALDPLLPGSSVRVAKSEYEDRLALARENTALTLRTARDDASNQLRMIKDSVDKIGNLTNTVDASKRAYELTNAAYQLGTGRILDLQDAEVSWQGARIQLLNERLKLASLIFDFEAKYQTGN